MNSAKQRLQATEFIGSFEQGYFAFIGNGVGVAIVWPDGRRIESIRHIGFRYNYIKCHNAVGLAVFEEIGRIRNGATEFSTKTKNRQASPVVESRHVCRPLRVFRTTEEHQVN